jgi:malic enzyme
MSAFSEEITVYYSDRERLAAAAREQPVEATGGSHAGATMARDFAAIQAGPTRALALAHFVNSLLTPFIGFAAAATHATAVHCSMQASASEATTAAAEKASA